MFLNWRVHHSDRFPGWIVLKNNVFIQIELPDKSIPRLYRVNFTHTKQRVANIDDAIKLELSGKWRYTIYETKFMIPSVLEKCKELA
jgi:hypothetical protein